MGEGFGGAAGHNRVFSCLQSPGIGDFGGL